MTNLFAETKAWISVSLLFLHCSSSFYSSFLHIGASSTMWNQCKKETEGQVIMCSHTRVAPPHHLIRRDHPGPGSQGRIARQCCILVGISQTKYLLSSLPLPVPPTPRNIWELRECLINASHKMLFKYITDSHLNCSVWNICQDPNVRQALRR